MATKYDIQSSDLLAVYIVHRMKRDMNLTCDVRVIQDRALTGNVVQILAQSVIDRKLDDHKQIAQSVIDQIRFGDPVAHARAVIRKAQFKDRKTLLEYERVVL